MTMIAAEDVQAQPEKASTRAKQAIGVVILDWNKPESTIACAQSVLAEFDDNKNLLSGTVIVVDNGSDAANVEHLNSGFAAIADARVHLILNGRNLGFSGGMNVGIRTLQAVEPDHIWLLNNDIVVKPGALRALTDYVERDPASVILGPTVVDRDTGLVQCAGGCHYNRWLGLERPINQGSAQRHLTNTGIATIDYIYGAAIFLRADFLYAIGGLDERYFLFYEELELARRLGRCQQMAWCPDAVVYHGGGTSNAPGKESRAVTAYYAAVSAYRFTWRHYPYCLPSVVISRILGLAWLGLTGRNFKLIGSPLRALFTFLTKTRGKSNI